MFIVLVIIVVWIKSVFHVQGYNVLTPVQKRWWMDSASALEPFMNPPVVKEKNQEDIADHSPGKPSPVDLYRYEPYLLLEDVLPKGKETPSSVTSQSCYTMDAEAYLSKVGNYRQLTNNYKREYPDHCSSPLQEFILPFYEPKPFTPSSSRTSGTGASL